MANARDLPDGAYFAFGAVIGALLGGAAASLIAGPLWASVSISVVAGIAFGFLGVALRDEILLLFLP